MCREFQIYINAMKEMEGARREKAILENYEAWVLEEEEHAGQRIPRHRGTSLLSNSGDLGKVAAVPEQHLGLWSVFFLNRKSGIARE